MSAWAEVTGKLFAPLSGTLKQGIEDNHEFKNTQLRETSG